jgi:hypothetical protein
LPSIGRQGPARVRAPNSDKTILTLPPLCRGIGTLIKISEFPKFGLTAG